MIMIANTSMANETVVRRNLVKLTQRVFIEACGVAYVVAETDQDAALELSEQAHGLLRHGKDNQEDIDGILDRLYNLLWEIEELNEPLEADMRREIRQEAIARSGFILDVLFDFSGVMDELDNE